MDGTPAAAGVSVVPPSRSSSSSSSLACCSSLVIVEVFHFIFPNLAPGYWQGLLFRIPLGVLLLFLAIVECTLNYSLRYVQKKFMDISDVYSNITV